MGFNNIVAVLLPLVCLCSGAFAQQENLTVSVYYETLCPDSIRFIVTQLYPVFKQVGGNGNPYFNIDFVPYGKATTSKDENGNFQFQCQHGNRECEGNKMHSCALTYLPQESRAAFINCSMSSSNPPDAGPDCARELGLDYSSVEKCIGDDGPKLLAANGDRTHSLNPQLYYVPWITYNGEFSESDLEDSQKDFQELLCKKLGSRGPKLCGVESANVTVSVFYETLCPDSIRFITTQLYPTFEQFGGNGNPYFDIDFVPYGKATTYEGPNGSFYFTCQHGQRECQGNMVHACAQEIYAEKDAEAFVHCSMASKDPQPPEAGPNCAEALGLDYAPVDACFNSWHGAELLAANGNRTHSLDPALYFVPWILFDGKFNEDDLELSLVRFISVICEKLGANAPSQCEGVKLYRRH